MIQFKQSFWSHIPYFSASEAHEKTSGSQVHWASTGQESIWWQKTRENLSHRHYWWCVFYCKTRTSGSEWMIRQFSVLVLGLNFKQDCIVGCYDENPLSIWPQQNSPVYTEQQIQHIAFWFVNYELLYTPRLIQLCWNLCCHFIMNKTSGLPFAKLFFVAMFLI